MTGELAAGHHYYFRIPDACRAIDQKKLPVLHFGDHMGDAVDRCIVSHATQAIIHINISHWTLESARLYIRKAIARTRDAEAKLLHTSCKTKPSRGIQYSAWRCCGEDIAYLSD